MRATIVTTEYKKRTGLGLMSPLLTTALVAGLISFNLMAAFIIEATAIEGQGRIACECLVLSAQGIHAFTMLRSANVA